MVSTAVQDAQVTVVTMRCSAYHDTFGSIRAMQHLGLINGKAHVGSWP